MVLEIGGNLFGKSIFSASAEDNQILHYEGSRQIPEDEKTTTTTTTSALNPQTIINDNTIGTTVWANVNNAKLSDNTYANNYPTYGGIQISNYLKATNFGFVIPDGVTIKGILVEIEKKQASTSHADILDEEVKIVKANGTIGTENKATSTQWPLTDTYLPYGSATNLWGETWTATDINNANFGVVLAVTGLVEFESPAYVDNIKITITYEI